MANERPSGFLSLETLVSGSDELAGESHDRLTARALDQLFVALVAAVVALVLLSLVTSDFPILYSRFDLDSEATVPAWYSSALLLCVSLSAAILHLIQPHTASRPTIRLFWLVFAGAYLFLSLDEAARIHEALEERLRVKWIYLYSPLALIFLIYCATYLTRIETRPRVRRWILGGILVYGLGALAGEALLYFFYVPSVEPLEVVVEESLEMIGTSMVLVGCLHGVFSTLSPDYSIAHCGKQNPG